MKLTDTQWYDLASRHANADWNSDGYMNAVKALCADFATQAARQPAAATGQEPVAWESVIAAIYAVDTESSRRGEMFPQTKDEQREDRRAVKRVCEMIRWYATSGGACVEQFKGWPRVAATIGDNRAGMRTVSAQWLRDVLVYIEAGIETPGLMEADHSIEARRLLATAAHPSQPAESKRVMTDAEIREIWLRETGFNEQAAPFAILDFARALLACAASNKEKGHAE